MFIKILDIQSLLIGNRSITNNLFSQLILPPPPPQSSLPINNPKFYTMLNSSGRHSLLRTVPPNGSLGSQRLPPLRYVIDNNYTLRSAKSSHSHGGYSMNRGITGKLI